MEINFKEKLAICITVCGPSHRSLALKRLLDFDLYPDLENLYFFVLTDKVNYFKDVKRKNLIVRNLKEFYKDYPEVEKNEFFLEWDDDEDIEGYGKKYNDTGYKFSTNLQRFHIKMAAEYGITNVGIFNCDSWVFLDKLKDCFFNQDKNLIYWTGGGGHYEGVYYVERGEPPNEHFQGMIDRGEIAGNCMLAGILKSVSLPLLDKINSNFGTNLSCEDKVMIYDGAAQLYSFVDTDIMFDFFNAWNFATKDLHETGDIEHFSIHPYWIRCNDYMLPIILNAMDIRSGSEFFAKQNQPDLEQEVLFIMRVRHDWDAERPWTVPQNLKPGDRKWNPEIQNWEIIGS